VSVDAKKKFTMNFPQLLLAAEQDATAVPTDFGTRPGTEKSSLGLLQVLRSLRRKASYFILKRLPARFSDKSKEIPPPSFADIWSVFKSTLKKDIIGLKMKLKDELRGLKKKVKERIMHPIIPGKFSLSILTSEIPIFLLLTDAFFFFFFSYFCLRC
jgi:hypothetical protein